MNSTDVHALPDGWLDGHTKRGRRLWKRLIEYISLPVPGSLPSREWGCRPGEYTWDDWEEDMKRRYPVRYFLQETAALELHVRVVRPIKDAWYWVRTHTYNRYHMLDMRSPANGYAWGWQDCNRLIILASFNLLRNYVEQEKPFKNINWESDEGHHHAAAEIRAIYDWWTSGRAKEHQAVDDEYEDSRKERWSSWGEAEQHLDERDDEMLIRLIKIREYLWT
jgi:hypothetical protein